MFIARKNPLKRISVKKQDIIIINWKIQRTKRLQKPLRWI